MTKSKIRKIKLRIREKKYISNIKFNPSLINNIIKKSGLKKPVIGGYFPVNFEINCLNILEELFKKKFTIALPKINKNNSMEFYKYSLSDPLALNKYGIPETTSDKILYPDILFVPLVAFDHKLFRIGYGGGYYDRYLAKLEKKKKFLSVGLAFFNQKVKKVPKDRFDKSLNLIITEKKLFL